MLDVPAEEERVTPLDALLALCVLAMIASVAAVWWHFGPIGVAFQACYLYGPRAERAMKAWLTRQRAA